MTSPERIYGLIQAVRYIVAADIPGAIVECGVWRGGSMMAVALTLQSLNARRELFLFDTFEGMPPPTEVDRDFRGVAAAEIFRSFAKRRERWCAASLEEVRANIESTGYCYVQFIKGRVEDTIPVRAPQSIALLRLDTDWYESTKHELTHLYPRVMRGGVLIVDDYGHWQGSRKATDEYFAQSPILLNRLDYTGRIAVKV